MKYLLILLAIIGMFYLASKPRTIKGRIIEVPTTQAGTGCKLKIDGKLEDCEYKGGYVWYKGMRYAKVEVE